MNRSMQGVDLLLVGALPGRALERRDLVLPALIRGDLGHGALGDPVLLGDGLVTATGTEREVEIECIGWDLSPGHGADSSSKGCGGAWRYDSELPPGTMEF